MVLKFSYLKKVDLYDNFTYINFQEASLDGVRAVAALLEVGPHDAEEPLAP